MRSEKLGSWQVLLYTLLFCCPAFVSATEPLMVKIPAGTFLMGCVPADTQCRENEKPRHTVTLDSFYIDAFEVTVAQFNKCAVAGACLKSSFRTCDDHRYCNYGHPKRLDHPMNCVDWSGAKQYANWSGKSLPTEAQWEYAARGGREGFIYPWGDMTPSCKYAVMDEGVNGCGIDSTWPVGSKLLGKNGYGLFDMAGSVWEWCLDSYAENYFAASPKKNPSGPQKGWWPVVRGGSWSDREPGDFRSSFRIN